MTLLKQIDNNTRLVKKWHLFEGRTVHLQRFRRGKWKTTAWCINVDWFEKWQEYYHFLVAKEFGNL